jgi:hypothetical protein
MKCPVCESLNREHNHLCEEEARLTLAERAVSSTAAAPAPSAPLREQILSARKRQSRVASDLRNHKALAHSA